MYDFSSVYCKRGTHACGHIFYICRLFKEIREGETLKRIGKIGVQTTQDKVTRDGILSYLKIASV